MSAAVLRGMGFPGRYVQGEGALQTLGSLLADLGYARPAVVVDPGVAGTVWPLAAQGLDRAGLPARAQAFDGECTDAVIAGLARSLPGDADVLVALGGGKAIDATKGAARARGLPIVVCPTAASSDAPTSRLIVRYDESHRVAGVERMTRNPEAVVVDTGIIARAPARLFAAGIGDALSKSFEVRACRAAGGLNAYGYAATETAVFMADRTYRVLREDAAQAWADVRAQRATAAVERVVEATILLSGIGFESGGLSLAHALIRGLTTVPEFSARLHGELVAFGTLAQAVAMALPRGQVVELLTLLRATGLPTGFGELGLHRELSAGERARLAQATLDTPYSANLLPALTPERLWRALDGAHEIGLATR